MILRFYEKERNFNNKNGSQEILNSYLLKIDF